MVHVLFSIMVDAGLDRKWVNHMNGKEKKRKKNKWRNCKNTYSVSIYTTSYLTDNAFIEDIHTLAILKMINEKKHGQKWCRPISKCVGLSILLLICSTESGRVIVSNEISDDETKTGRSVFERACKRLLVQLIASWSAVNWCWSSWWWPNKSAGTVRSEQDVRLCRTINGKCRTQQ